MKCILRPDDLLAGIWGHRGTHSLFMNQYTRYATMSPITWVLVAKPRILFSRNLYLVGKDRYELNNHKNTYRDATGENIWMERHMALQE